MADEIRFTTRELRVDEIVPSKPVMDYKIEYEKIVFDDARKRNMPSVTKFFRDAASASNFDASAWGVDYSSWGTPHVNWPRRELVVNDWVVDDFNDIAKWIVLHELGHVFQQVTGLVELRYEDVYWVPTGENMHRALYYCVTHEDYAKLPWESHATAFAFNHPMCPKGARELVLNNERAGIRAHGRSHFDITEEEYA